MINLKELSKSNIVKLSAILAVIFIAVFSLPNQFERFALFPDKFLLGEYWRILTFQFSHLNSQHLIENVFGIALVGVISAELKSRVKEFSVVLFLAGMLPILALVMYLDFPVLGASAAIYGAFGLIAFKAERFKIKKEHVLGFVTLAIFIQVVMYSMYCGGSGCSQLSKLTKQSFLHFAGLVSGVVIFLGYNKFQGKINVKKRKILRGVLK